MAAKIDELEARIKRLEVAVGRIAEYGDSRADRPSEVAELIAVYHRTQNDRQMAHDLAKVERERARLIAAGVVSR